MYIEDADNLIKTIGLEDLSETLKMTAVSYDTDIHKLINSLVRIGLENERLRIELLCSPPHTPPFKNNININNNNEVVINKLSLKDLTKSNPISSGKSPLEKKAERKRNRKPKNKTVMPCSWNIDRENETIGDQRLVDYCEKHGHDWHSAKELFLAFVDHHLSKGSKFVKWENAFYTWVRNDKKFNGTPAKKTGNVVGLYKTSDPMKELFDDRS